MACCRNAQPFSRSTMTTEPARARQSKARFAISCWSRFKPEADTASRADAIAHFARMRTEIPGVTAFEQGANNSL